MQESKQVSLIPMVTLVLGYLVGAGILGIPVTSGLVGVLPALVLMTLLMLVMFYSGSIIAREVIETRDESFNYPSLYQKYFGVVGKWIAIITNLIILYGLIIAYLVGGAKLFTKFFGIQSFWMDKLVLILFFLLLTSLCLKGIELVKKCNVVFVALLWIAFLVLIAIGATYIVPEHYLYSNLSIVPMAAPIILTSFFFHNIIPNISYNSGWNPGMVNKAMFIGLFIGLLLNALWFLVGVGVLPLNEGKMSIEYAYVHNYPTLTPMTEIINNPVFMTSAMTFGFVAIITSFFGNGLGLMGFMRDVLENTFHKKSRALNVVLCFAPPLIISLIKPDIFLKAMDIVGGVGIVLLFGILPSIISLIKPKVKFFYKLLSIIVLIICLSVFAFEISEKTGIVNVKLPKMITDTQKAGQFNKIK